MIDAGVRDVTARARQMLDESPHSELRSLQVEQRGNRVFIRGRVPTFYAKQMAQEAVRNVVRGLQVINNVSVE